MKNIRFIALLALMLGGMTMKAQEYHPIVEEGKQWNVMFSYPWTPPNPPHRYTDIYKIGGDTLLDGMSYKVMYTTRNEDLTDWSICGAIRETEDKQVFYRKNGASNEQMLYDFSMEVGDTIFMYYDDFMVVVDKGETIVNEEPRQQIVLEYPWGGDEEEVWIEGIGSLYGIIDSGSLFLVGGSTNLLCNYEDGDLIWQNPNWNSCYIVYSGGGQNGLVVTPTSLIFDEPATPQTFTISNQYDVNVTVSSIYVQPDDNIVLVSHAVLPQTLQPGKSMDVEVKLNANGNKGYNTYRVYVVTSTGTKVVIVKVNEEAPSSFAPQGAEWYFDVFNPWGTNPDYERFFVEGDTIIQGHQCSIIHQHFVETGHEGVYEGEEFVYEEDNKVYWFNPTTNAFTTLYDFDAKAGESWYYEVGDCSHLVTVDSIGSVTWDGHTYRTQWVRWYNENLPMYYSGKIIEGIGYEKGLFPNLYVCNGWEVFDMSEIEYLRCYVVDDEILYHEGDYDCDQIVVNTFCWDGTIADAYAGGDGTVENPYQIDNAKQLALLSSQTLHGTGGDAYYQLTNNINLERCDGGYNDWPSIGQDGHPFTGHFDGNGKYVLNLHQSQNPAYVYKGLFGYTDGADIRNVNLVYCELANGAPFAGGLVAYAVLTDIANCSVQNSQICTNNGVAGGIVGEMISGTIKGCASKGLVRAEGQVDIYCVGGIAGSIYDSCVISNSYHIGKVIADNGLNGLMGGIAGHSAGDIFNVYNAGEINLPNTSSIGCGTIVGNVQDGTYRNCYWLENALPPAGNYYLPEMPGSTWFHQGTTPNSWILNEEQYGTTDLVEALNRGSNNEYLWLEDTEDNNEGFPVCIEIVPYHPIIGSEWYYEILNDDGSITYQYLKHSGDTTIQDEPVQIIVKINTLYDKGEHINISHEYIYERNNVVYWWNKTLGEFTVLYDFGAEEGDEWVINVGTYSLVMHVDAVELYEYDGHLYKMLQVSDAENLFSGTIVCGIGHLTSFFPEKLLNQDKGFRVEGIRCFWQNGELVFKYGDRECNEVYEEFHDYGMDEHGLSERFRVYPNPTDGLLHVETRHGTSLQYRIANILGQTVLSGTITSDKEPINVSSLSEGIYFILVGAETAKLLIVKSH